MRRGQDPNVRISKESSRRYDLSASPYGALGPLCFQSREGMTLAEFKPLNNNTFLTPQTTICK